MDIRILIIPNEDDITVEDEDENILPASAYLSRELGSYADSLLDKHKLKGLVFTEVESR